MTILQRVLILLLLQTAALAAMVGKKQYTLNTGTEILLETAPVDPRSLFRGDYVRLNFVISTLDLDALEGDDEFERRDTVYVVLAPGERYWNPASVHHARPAVSAPQVVIQGEVEYVIEIQSDPDAHAPRPANQIRVRYGIENYFVPEGAGIELENRGANEVVDLRVAVDAAGRSGIKAVLVNDQEKYVESLFR
jgi:uncharacterized membrane-anchored protein